MFVDTTWVLRNRGQIKDQTCARTVLLDKVSW